MAVDYFHYLVVTGPPPVVKDFVHRRDAAMKLATGTALRTWMERRARLSCLEDQRTGAMMELARAMKKMEDEAK